MAEVIGLGASILSIAAFGVTVVTKLRKFGNSYASADAKLAILAADVALTSSILTELGNTITEYEKDLQLTAHNFVRVKATCERDFERLNKALKQAKKEDEMNATDGGGGKKFGKWKVASGEGMSGWDKLKFALGGEDELKELVGSLETAKSNLQLLLDSVNLVILRKLNQKHLLDEEQSADLRDLVRHIPILVKVLQGSKFIPFKARISKAEDAITVQAHFGTPGTKEVPPVGTKSFAERVNFTAVPFETWNIDEDKKDDLEKAAPPYTPKDSGPPEKPKSNKTDSPIKDVLTMPKAFVNPNAPIVPALASSSVPVLSRGFNVSDEDKISPPQAPAHIPITENVEKAKETKTSLASSVVDSDTIYEGWLLTRNKNALKPTHPSSVVSIMGFKVKLFQDRSIVTYYSSDTDDENDRPFKISPYSSDQALLSSHVANFQKTEKAGKSDKLTRARIGLILGSLPIVARNEIKRLIRARNRSSPLSHKWLLVAVVPIDEPWARKLLKSIEGDRGIKKHFELLLVLRGGTIDEKEKIDNSQKKRDLPDRYTNPWYKPGPPRPGGIVLDEGYISAAPRRNYPPPPPPGRRIVAGGGYYGGRGPSPPSVPFPPLPPIRDYGIIDNGRKGRGMAPTGPVAGFAGRSRDGDAQVIYESSGRYYSSEPVHHPLRLGTISPSSSRSRLTRGSHEFVRDGYESDSVVGGPFAGEERRAPVARGWKSDAQDDYVPHGYKSSYIDDGFDFIGPPVVTGYPDNTRSKLGTEMMRSDERGVVVTPEHDGDSQGETSHRRPKSILRYGDKDSVDDVMVEEVGGTDRRGEEKEQAVEGRFGKVAMEREILMRDQLEKEAEAREKAAREQLEQDIRLSGLNIADIEAKEKELKNRLEREKEERQRDVMERLKKKAKEARERAEENEMKRVERSLIIDKPDFNLRQKPTWSRSYSRVASDSPSSRPSEGLETVLNRTEAADANLAYSDAASGAPGADFTRLPVSDLWGSHTNPFTGIHGDEDDDLLPQDEAERLMDQFLATFTEGGNAGDF